MLKKVFKKLVGKMMVPVTRMWAQTKSRAEKFLHAEKAPYSLTTKNRQFYIHTVASLVILVCAFSVVSSCAGRIASSTAPTPATTSESSDQSEEPQLEDSSIASLVIDPEAFSDTYAYVAEANETVVIEANRDEPIYEVYKSGRRINVPASLQWFLRDLTDEHNYPERLFYGMILDESDFYPRANNSGQWLGLAQITTYWLRAEPLKPYRLTDDHRSRDLFNAEHNMLTMIEMWNYARDVYNLDPWDEEGAARLLYWHNTGSDPRVISTHNVLNRRYTRDIFGYATELVNIEYDGIFGLVFDLNLEYLNNETGLGYSIDDFTSEPDPVSTRVGGTVEMPVHERPSYTGLGTRGIPRFLGWNAEKNGSGLWYEPGDIMLDVVETYYLFAQWQIMPAAITDTSTIISISYSPGEHGLFEPQAYEVVMSALTPHFSGELVGEDGWEFIGWLPEVIPVTVMDVEYVAQWKPLLSFEVAYMPGEHGAFTQQTYIVTEEGFSTPEFVGEIAGAENWKFDGWYPEVAEIVTENQVYTAQWRQAFSIRYEPGVEGTFTAQKHSAIYGTATPQFAEAITGQPEYEFAGWLPGISETVTGDTVYVAQWRPIPRFEIAYLPGGQGLFEPQPHSAISGAQTPMFSGKPIGAENWEFDGWLPQISLTVTESVEYIAQWKYLPQYEVSYFPGEHGLFERQTHMLEDGALTPKFNGKPIGAEGWEFDGWYPEIRDFVRNDQAYTAQWKQIFEIRYTSGSEGLFDAQSHQAVDGTPTPQFTGAITGNPEYEFTGWLPSLSQTTTGDVTYVAQWKPLPKFDITYLPGEHGLFESQSYTAIAGLPMPLFAGATDGAVGWEFDGWLPEVSPVVAEDAEYVAQWKLLPRYEVIYLPGSYGAFERQQNTVIEGFPTPDFDGEPSGVVGWEFDGWQPTIDTEVSRNATYTAQWKALPRYDITYLPGEHGLFYPQTNIAIEGLSTPAFFGEIAGGIGWEFDGWQPAFSELATMDQVYTAQWKLREYAIVYAPGAQGVFEQQVKHANYDNLTPLFTGLPRGNEGWLFDGWEPAIIETVTADQTYTARWKLQDFDVRYMPGSQGTFALQAYQSGFGTPTPMFNGTPTGNDGWQFNGWQPSVDELVLKDQVYTAQWKQIFTVRYDPGVEGRFDTQEYRITDGSPTPQFAGDIAGLPEYEFVGWRPGVSQTATGDVTYVAQWEPLPEYRVSYLPGEHGLFERQSHVIMSGLPTPTFAGRADGAVGWEFDGWLPEINGAVNGDVEYVAQWKPLPRFEISYLPGEYGLFEPQSNIAIIDFPTPGFVGETVGAIGWEFDGWYPEASLTATEDVEYTAQWKPVPTYEITYLPGEYGSFAPQMHTVEVGQMIPAFDGEIAGMGNWRFNGWVAESGQVEGDDVEYVAQWRPLQEYKITYLSGEHGAFLPRMHIAMEDSITPEFDRELVGRSGWRFDGWYPEISPTVTTDVEYVALWSADVANQQRTHTIVYEPGTRGTFAAQEYQAAYGDATPGFAEVPVGQAGFVFTGWSLEIRDTVVGDAVYTAQWTQAGPQELEEEPQTQGSLLQESDEMPPVQEEPQLHETSLAQEPDSTPQEQQAPQQVEQDPTHEPQEEPVTTPEEQQSSDLSSVPPQGTLTENSRNADAPMGQTGIEPAEGYILVHPPQAGIDRNIVIWVSVVLFGAAGIVIIVFKIRTSKKYY